MMAAASCNERAPETQCAKEVASKLAQLQAERAKQDNMWEKGQEQPTSQSIPQYGTNDLLSKNTKK
jgi:hypothetical protein